MGICQSRIRNPLLRSVMAVLTLIVVANGNTYGQTRPVKSQNAYPIDLTTALRLAGSDNLQIAEAEARVRQASGDRLSAYERFFPVLSAEWRFVRHEGRTQATEGEFLDVDKQFHRPGGRIAASWDLNEALFSLLAAHRQVEFAGYARDNTADSTLLRVANAYFTLSFADAGIRIARRAIAVSSDFVEQSERSVREGIGFQVDILRAKTQLAHDRLRLHQAQEEAAAASAKLAALLNLDEPITLTPLDTTVVPLTLADTSGSVEDWMKLAVGHHPQVQVRRTRLASARLEKQQAVWGPLLPEIEGQALFSGFGPAWSDLRRSRDYSVSLHWTIGPGGLLDLGRIRARSARLESAKFQYEATRDAVTENVVRLHEWIRVRAAMLDVAQEGLEAARETLRIAAGRRDLGIGLALEVILAADALTQAENDYARAVVDYNRAQIEAMAALGRLGSAD